MSESDKECSESCYDSLSEVEEIVEEPVVENSEEEESDDDFEIGATTEQEFDHLDFSEDAILNSFEDNSCTLYFGVQDGFMEARSIIRELSECGGETARHDLCLLLNWALSYDNGAAALETGLVAEVFAHFKDFKDVIVRLLLLLFLRLCFGVRECRCYYSENTAGLAEFLSTFLTQENYFGNYLRMGGKIETEMQQDVLAIAYAVCTWPHFSYTKKAEVENTPDLYRTYVRSTHFKALVTVQKGGGLPFFPGSDSSRDVPASNCLRSRLTGITGRFCPATIALSTIHLISDTGPVFLREIRDQQEVVESLRAYHASHAFNWEAIRLSHRVVSRKWFLKNTAEEFINALWKPVNVFLMGGTFDRTAEVALLCLNDCISKFQKVYNIPTNFLMFFFNAFSRRSSIVDWVTNLGDYQHVAFPLVWGLALSLTPIIFDRHTITKLCNRLRWSMFTGEPYNPAVGYTAAAVAYLVASERIRPSKNFIFKLIEWVHKFEGLPLYKRTQLVRRLYQAAPDMPTRSAEVIALGPSGLQRSYFP